MNIRDLKQGLFWFQGELFLLLGAKTREHTNIFALKLLPGKEGIRVVDSLWHGDHFNDVQAAEIHFDVLVNNEKANKKRKFCKLSSGWEFQSIKMNTCFVPYSRDKEDSQYLDFNDPGKIHLRWDSKDVIRGTDCHAINLRDGYFDFTEPYWAQEVGPHKTYPVRRIANLKITVKEEVKEIKKEAV